VGTSGKARYSADVSVNDYRWVWTLVRDNMAPPPYNPAQAPRLISSYSLPMASCSDHKHSLEENEKK
jgi:hypothetical protein